MQRYWIVAGDPDNWQTALAFGGIWGLRQILASRWEKFKKEIKPSCMLTSL
ncbi:MAG: hypothetical protein QW351_06355 [Candidatus Caldarchaeum sp.]